MNSVSLIGRLTKDPELKVATNGKKFTRFTLAVANQKNKDGSENTAWINVVAFNRQAETLCNYMTKGRQLGVTGYITTGSYKDKDGKTIYTTEVIANNVEFIGSKNDADAGEPAKPDYENAFAEADEDCPF